MADKATTESITGNANQDEKEPMNVLLKHSTIVRVLNYHRLTKKDNNEIIDEAINFFLDQINE